MNSPSTEHSSEEKSSTSLNRVDLSFSHSKSHLEKLFRENYFNKSLNHVRNCHIYSILFYFSSASIDYIIFPNQAETLFSIRFMVVIPIFILGYFFTYSSLYKALWQQISFFYILLTGGSFIAFSIIAQPPQSYDYYVGVFFCMMFGYTFIRERFIYSSIAGLILTFAYLFVSTNVIEMPESNIFQSNFYLFLGNFLGMLIARHLETSARRDFILEHRLSEEQEKVLELNRNLEHKVSERTLELEHALGQLRESEETFSRFFNQGNIGMAITSVTKGWLNVNSKLCKLLGYSKEELLKKTWTEMTYADDLKPDLDLFQKMMSGEIENYEMDKRFIRKDKSVIYTHLTVSCTRNPDNTVGRVMATLQDISKQKFAEQRNIHLNKVLKSIRDVNQLIVRVKDYDTLIREGCNLLAANRGYNSVFIVLTNEGNQPVSWSQSGLGASLDAFGAMLERGDLPPCCNARLCMNVVLVDGNNEFCLHCPISDGCAENPSLVVQLIQAGESFGYLLAVLDPGLKVDDEELGLFSEIADDISFALKHIKTESEHKSSERKREALEHQLSQVQKMEAVGRLAGGVAHDFNNMIGVILGFSELAIEKLSAGDPALEYLSEVKLAAQRSADITRQLLAFARKQTIAPVTLDLNDTIEGMLKMLRRLIGEDIDLIWKPAKDLWTVKMDPSQLDQVLANLMVNARDAIAGVGKITIETSNAEFVERAGVRHDDFSSGAYVMLAVTDNGSGMDQETLSKLFEPFFTTKKLGQGTGLGLSTIYGIVKQNGGFVKVYSEPGKGTAFRIYLPRDESAASTDVKTRKSEEILTGTETVMLVEDEKSLLKFAKILLEDLGYTVLAASSPRVALEHARQHDGEIHLLMTDVVMPEMSGRDLCAQIINLRPGIKCLYMSGYTANVIAHRGVLEEGVHFLQKPFSRDSLAKKLREALF